MVTIDETTIAMAFAFLGVVFSIGWIVLALYGIDLLRDVRDSMAESDGSDES